MFHMLACYWSTVDWVAAYGSRFALLPEKADCERERGVAAQLLCLARSIGCIEVSISQSLLCVIEQLLQT